MSKRNTLAAPNIQLLTAMMPSNLPPSYQRVPTTTSIDLELEDRSGYTKRPNGQEFDHTSTPLAVNADAEGSRSRRLKPTRYFWVPEKPIGGPALSILADPADSLEVVLAITRENFDLLHDIPDERLVFLADGATILPSTWRYFAHHPPETIRIWVDWTAEERKLAKKQEVAEIRRVLLLSFATAFAILGGGCLIGLTVSMLAPGSRKD
ncbi:hypothetical protein HD553DRAFT_352431 [Filobasidium floriforme]|uniref:uncharacterized protein n=1 Tax=Filobasidium floriforme TaxID=5210 RepID=UPI001E8CB999|nr:uncharacterized protein HD553DRAFT_352431 [Filobasidium floriforme]KAH8079971.1 hypothetical protein HD553DRAFT_352431 [Filobasidium floriforme]